MVIYVNENINYKGISVEPGSLLIGTSLVLCSLGRAKWHNMERLQCKVK